MRTGRAGHEKAFGYLRLKEAEIHPWRVFFQTNPFAHHVLKPAAKGLLGKEFGKQPWERLLEMDWGGGFDECQKAAQAAFPLAKGDLAEFARIYPSSLPMRWTFLTT